MNEKILSIILKSFNEKKNSHAFLLETNDIEECLNEVYNLIKKINKDRISIDCDLHKEIIPDVRVIMPEGKEIRKEQILNVLNEFQTYPVTLKHRYYIILNSEMMNHSSANVLLKFLEEPENAVVGVFITSNRQAMINTIVSRCQLYKVVYKPIEFNDDYLLTFNDEMNKKNIFNKILYLDNFFSKDRTQNILNLKQLKNMLYSILRNQDDFKIIIHRIKLLDECILRLTRNGNQDLILLDLARKW